MATTTQTKVSQFTPYIFFYGRCEEALEFYKAVFGGSYEAMRNSDAPSSAQMPPGAEDKVMHATFTAPGISFLASDGGQTKTIDPEATNICLSVTAADDAEGERLCTALSEGGSVVVKFDDAFWGGKFGEVVDRFGTGWMITTSTGQ